MEPEKKHSHLKQFQNVNFDSFAVTWRWWSVSFFHGTTQMKIVGVLVYVGMKKIIYAKYGVFCEY